MKPLEFLVVMEIIVVNMLTLTRCCKRKYSYRTIAAALGVFTVVVIGLVYQIIKRLHFYGNGNGLFVLFGFLYLLPLSVLYKEKLSKLFTIICMAWVYTLGVFSLSVQIGKLLGPEDLVRNVSIIETVIFLTGTPVFQQMVVKRYIAILEYAREGRDRWSAYLTIISFMHFLTILAVNFVFAGEKGSPVKILAVFLLLLTIFCTYLALHDMVVHKAELHALDYTAHHDLLTGVKNRLSLYADLEELLKTDRVFTVLFMDLDRFKQVNDQYGHLMGDRYLQHFCRVTSETLGMAGTLYRLGGDEFLAICDGEPKEELVRRMELCKEWEPGAPCPFNRVSIGIEVCRPPHMSVDELLEKADRGMYLKKLEKK